MRWLYPCGLGLLSEAFQTRDEVVVLLMLCCVICCHDVPAAQGDRADEGADQDNSQKLYVCEITDEREDSKRGSTCQEQSAMRWLCP